MGDIVNITKLISYNVPFLARNPVSMPPILPPGWISFGNKFIFPKNRNGEFHPQIELCHEWVVLYTLIITA